MTSTVGGATWSTAGTLSVGTSPQTGLDDFTELGSTPGLYYGAGDYVTYWTFTADSYQNVTFDTSASSGDVQTDLYVRSGGTDFDSSDYVQQATGDAFSNGHARVVWLAQPGVTYHVALVAVTPGVSDTFAVTTTSRATPVLTAGTATFGHADWELGWYELPLMSVITDYWLVTSPVDGQVTIDFSASTADPAISTAVVELPDGAGQSATVTYDGNSGSQPSPTVTFTAEAGVTYVVYAFVDTPDEAGSYSVTTTLPMTSASVVIEVVDGTDITIGDDGSTAYTLTAGGLGRPIVTPRYTYAPESPDVDGKVLLQAARDLSALPLEVLVTGSTASDLDAKIAALDAALWQFSYTVTVTVAGVATVYQSQPTVSQTKDGVTLHGFADQNIALLSVTIPVQPNPVVA